MTDTRTTTEASRTAPTDEASRRARSGARSGSGSDLVTETGRTTIADTVVAKIAGVATREIDGVHAMGGPAGRAIGVLKEKIISQPSVTQGVTVEVGEREAAVDLDIVVEYGVSIPDLSEAIRGNVSDRIESMTGLDVTEVNISVNDVYLEGDGGDDENKEREPRVE